jgi:hypothetical protein
VRRRWLGPSSWSIGVGSKEEIDQKIMDIGWKPHTDPHSLEDLMKFHKEIQELKKCRQRWRRLRLWRPAWWASTLSRAAIIACSLRAGAVGFWDPAAKTNKFCEEIANGRLAMMTVIGMLSACRRGWLLEPGCEDQRVLRGDRERPPGQDGDHRMFTACRRGGLHGAGDAGYEAELVNANDDDNRPVTTSLATIPDLNESGLVRAVRPHEDTNDLKKAMMTVSGMFSACRRGWLLEPGCEDQQVLRGDRERPPGHDGGHRHVPCGQAPVGFWDPAAKTNRFCEEIGTAAWP